MSNFKIQGEHCPLCHHLPTPMNACGNAEQKFAQCSDNHSKNCSVKPNGMYTSLYAIEESVHSKKFVIYKETL